MRWVSELLNHHGTWDWDKINQHFLSVDRNKIQKISLFPRAGEDFVSWAPEKSGVFTMCSTYKLASDELSNEMEASGSSRPDGTRDG